ncbi:MAG: ORF6N domain-containing protein, partial [Candidatus Omnitrophota bacterium]
MKELILQGVIEQRIFLIRGKRVMLDEDLAELYEVENKQLTRQ